MLLWYLFNLLILKGKLRSKILCISVLSVCNFSDGRRYFFSHAKAQSFAKRLRGSA